MARGTWTRSGNHARGIRARLPALLRMGVGATPRATGGQTASLEELEVEVALLREENARLRLERHRPPSAGSVIELMRELGQSAGGAEPAGEESGGREASRDRSQALEAAQAIVECLAIRDGLLEACGEIGRAMRVMRSRLDALSGTVEAFGRDELLGEGQGEEVAGAARRDNGAARPSGQ
jgi:hypothetical protein